MNDMKIDEIENIVLNIIKPEGKIDLIYIFGSVITDKFNGESDIDIAILPKVIIAADELLKFKLELINYFGREIDLIDLQTAGLVLAKEIVYKGKAIYQSTEKAKDDYEYKTVSLYGQFIDDTSIVIAKIKERGRIYA